MTVLQRYYISHFYNQAQYKLRISAGDPTRFVIKAGWAKNVKLSAISDRK